MNKYLTINNYNDNNIIGDDKNMKDLDNIFTKKTCNSIFIISLTLFVLFEIFIFNILALFIFGYYGICILLYYFSTKIFINIKKKNIIECIIFLASSLCLILAGLTDINYNFFSSSHQIIDFVPENTSDINFILCSVLSIILIITSTIKQKINKK